MQKQPPAAPAQADRAPARVAVDAARFPSLPPRGGKPKAYRNVRREVETIGDELGLDLVSHDFRPSLASFLIVAARADEAAVTGMLGHANIEIARRIHAGDWREAEERNALVLRQLAEAGIGQ